MKVFYKFKDGSKGSCTLTDISEVNIVIELNYFIRDQHTKFPGVVITGVHWGVNE